MSTVAGEASGTGLLVERLGGLAGVGLPGARLRSLGRITVEELSDADRQAVDRLFTPARRGHSHAGLTRDGFCYRVTRTVPGAEPEVVENLPESRLPRSLLDCIRDELL